MRTRPAVALLALTLLVLACKDESGGEGEASVTVTTTTAASDEGSGDDGECASGTESCACIESGLCVAGLVCLSDVCVDPGGTSGGDEEGSGPKPEDGGSVDTGDAGTSDGGPLGSCAGNCGGSVPDGDGYCYCVPQCDFAGDCCADYEAECGDLGGCLFNSDCAANEVCSVANNECVPAYFHTFEVRVVTWEDHTPDCWDTLDADCLADAFFVATYGGSEVYPMSAVHNDVAYTDWLDEPFDVAINADEALWFAFYDWDDLSPNDFLNLVCFFDNVGDPCGPVGIEFLHAGGAVWDYTNAPEPKDRFFVQVSFVAK